MTQGFTQALSIPLAIDKGGTGVVNSGSITSGKWTPTLTDTANIDSSVAYECLYIRVGNIVSCAGRADVNTTAASSTTTTLGISLPIASTLGALEDLAGNIATNTSLNGGACYGDTSNNRCTAAWLSESTADNAYFFTFQYEII